MVWPLLTSPDSSFTSPLNRSLNQSYRIPQAHHILFRLHTLTHEGIHLPLSLGLMGLFPFSIFLVWLANS